MHLLWGVATVAVCYPLVGAVLRLSLKRRWSQQLLGILGVRLDIGGAAILPGSMVVSNHISWLDVYAINATYPMAFVSKAEVRDWPLIGWLAAKTDTIFLRRGSRGHAKIINEEIACLLASSQCAGVFPEGTTSDGSALLHFHAALLQPAIEAGRPIVPLAISYYTLDGVRSVAPAYVGETSLLESLWAIVAEPALVVRIVIMPSIASEVAGVKAHRRAIAEAARTSIALSLHLSPRAALPSVNS